MSEHFKAFDTLRTKNFFIGEMIWNFADFKTEQSKFIAFMSTLGTVCKLLRNIFDLLTVCLFIHRLEVTVGSVLFFVFTGQRFKHNNIISYQISNNPSISILIFESKNNYYD